MRMFNPETLNDAYALAKIQEECLVNNNRSGNLFWRNQRGGNDGNAGFNKGVISMGT